MEALISRAIPAKNDDIGGQWAAALSFSLVQVRMVGEAEMHAWKLVNGSRGEWDSDTAASVESL